MSTLDWNKIEEIVVNPSDKFDSDYWFDQLETVDLKSLENMEKATKVIQVLIMISKIKKENNESLAELIEEYDNQLTTKEKTITFLKRKVKTQESIEALPESEATIRSRLTEVEKELEELQAAHSSLTSDYENVVASETTAISQAESATKKAKELETRNRQLIEDLREYKYQVNYQRETMLAKGLGTAEAEVKSKKFKEKLIDALDENSALIQVNNKLKEATDQAKEELKDGKVEIEKCLEENLKLKGVLKYSDNIIEELRKENISLKAQNNEFKGILRTDDDVNDEMMVLISQKVKEWGELIESKELEISKLKRKIEENEREINLLKLDSDKNTITKLTAALEEKEIQVITLQEELKKAAGEIEHEIENFEAIKSRISSSETLSKVSKLEKEVSESQEKFNKTQENLELAETRIMELEIELENSVNRGQRIEKGIYGLSDAIAEMNDRKAQVKKLEKQQKETLELLSHMELKVDQLLDQEEFYRSKLALPIKDKELDRFMTSKRFQQEELKASLVILQNEIRSLEKERDELKEHIRNLGKLVAQKLGKDSELAISRELERNLEGHRPSTLITEIANLNHIVSELSNTREIKDEIAHQNKTIKADNKRLVSLLTDLAYKIKSHEPDHILLTAIEEATHGVAKIPECDERPVLADFNNFPRADKLKITFLENSTNFGAEFLVSMEEYLAETLKKNEVLENDLALATDKMTHVNSNYAVLKERVGLIYKDYKTQKDEWENERKLFKNKIQKLENKRSEDQVAILEYEKFVNTMRNEDEIKQNLAELTRKVVFLSVNEKALINRYSMVSEAENEANKKVDKLTEFISSLETERNKRISILEEIKDKASFKIKYLLRRLEDSVSKTVYSKIFEENIKLKQKYNQLLQNTNTNLFEKSSMDKLRIEIKRLSNDKNSLEEEVKVTQAKISLLESQQQSGETVESDWRMQFFEIKQVEDKQRIDYGKKLQQELKKSLELAEERNSQLEKNITQLTETNFELQSSETSLLSQLSDSVSRKEYDKMVEELTVAEKDQMLVNNEIRRLKESCDVLTSQIGVLNSKNTNLKEEIKVLNEYIRDYELQTPEKEVFGKLYRRIVKHSIAETNASQTMVAANQKLKKIETENLKLIKYFDFCDNNSFCHQIDATEKIRQLQSIISDIRSNYASSVPFIIHEKSALLLQFSCQEKEKLRNELNKVFEEMSDIQEELEKSREILWFFEKNIGDQVYKNKFEDFDSLKLENTRRKRKVDHLERQIQNMWEDFSVKEQILRELEEENAKLIKNSLVNKYSVETFDVVIKRFFNFNHDFQIIEEIPRKEEYKDVEAEKEGTIRKIEKKLLEFQNLLEKREREVLSRDELISQLRIKLLEVEVPFAEETKSENSKKALDAALMNIESLKKCLESKDATINQLRNLLSESNKVSDKRHEEYQEMMMKLSMKVSEPKLFDLSVDNSKNKIQKDMIREELEETINYQKKMIGSLNDQIKETRNQLNKIRDNYEGRIKESQREILELREKRSSEMKKVKNILHKVKVDVKEKNDTISRLKVEQQTAEDKESSLKKEMKDLQLQLSLKTEENFGQTTTISGLKQNLVALSSDKGTRRPQSLQERQDIQDKLKAVTRQLNNAKLQNKNYEISIKELEKDKENHVENISKLKKILIQLKKENDSLKKETTKVEVPVQVSFEDHVKFVRETESEENWELSPNENKIKLIRLEHENETLRNRLRHLEQRQMQMNII